MSENDRSTKIICANLDCQIAETGKCVEGFDSGACPHFGHQPPDVQKNKAMPEVLEAAEGVLLPGADKLIIADAGRFLRARDTRIIAIIGSYDAGKTSLIASLYDLFQEGPVSEVEYARSSTLHAFEHACHDARAASRRNVPHMNRTPRGDVQFYHLDLGGGAAGDELTLLIGDRSGEEYLSAADETSIVSSFSEIRRADSLNFLVDGERLLSDARHNLRSEIILMLQALVDGGAVQAGQRLALVLTKIDLLDGALNKERAENDFVSLRDRIETLFGHVFSVINTFKIAASPKTDILPRGTGIDELLIFWLEPALNVSIPLPLKSACVRAFARLQTIGGAM